MPLCGGFGEEREIDDDVRDLLFTLAAEIKEAHGGGTFEAKSFTTQVVAGTNFLVRGTVDGCPATVKIFRPLPHTGAPPKVVEAAKE